MDACHLGKHIVANNWLVGSYGDTTIAFHKTRDIIKFVFTDIRAGIELILQDHLHTRERSIAATLPQPVDGDVEPLGTAEHCCQRIAHGQVVVVVCMEVEVGIGIALDHLTEILNALQGVHDAKGIWQHKPADA